MRAHRLVLAALVLPVCGLTLAADDDADSSKARIIGTVVDPDGRPLPGISIWRTAKDDAPVYSDTSGHFTLDLSAGSVRYVTLLAADKDHTHMAMWDTDDTSPDVLASQVEARLVLRPSHAVTAKVVNGRGEPVAGASVAARHAYDYVAIGETDSVGQCALRVPEDAKITDFVAMKPGVGFDYYENKASRKWLDVKPLPVEVGLILDGISPVQVRAVDSKGSPISGARFHPWYLHKVGKNEDLNLGSGHSRFSISRTTDASGLASFDFLPAQLKGRVPMLCVGDEWHQQKDPTWPTEGNLRPDPPVVETTLLRCVSASGLVLHADGKPAAGILVQAEGRGKTNHYFRRVTRTAADGGFKFSFYPEQSYLIAVTEKNWAAQSISGYVVHEGDERTDLLFTLEKGTLVHGVVTHQETGAPLTDKTITVIEQGATINPDSITGPGPAGSAVEQLVRWTRTDADGRYSIRLGPGRYKISADYTEESRGDLLIGDKPDLQRDFRIMPRGE